MSSATLSSSPGPSTGHSSSKRAHSDGRDIENRVTKKSRTTPDDSGAKRDAKDKKKWHRKKKRKVSVVVVEDGHAHFQDSRRGITQSLLPSSPVKARGSRSESVVPVNDKSDKPDITEVTPSLKDKGKGKAVDCLPQEPLSIDDQISCLKKELDFKNELIEKHQHAVTQTQQAITCQVCLELMYKPYALSPCGHLACYECLVSWFKASPEDRPAPPPLHLRKKTCPHCRATITDRPVQVWGVKSIVSNFSKSGLLQGNFPAPDESSQNANENADPWEGIFPKIGRIGHGIGGGMLANEIGAGAGFLDDEDGGIFRCYDCMYEIWDGVCSHCGRAYPDYDEDGDDLGFGHPLVSDDDLDGEDGIGWMAHPDIHEVHGQALARLVEIENERVADEGREADIGRFLPVDDDEYEGSFINDEDDEVLPHLSGPRYRAAEIIELSSGSDEDDEFPVRRLPPNRRGGGAPSGQLPPIEVNDRDDGIREIRRPRGGARSGRRGPGPIVVLTDSDEEGEDNSPGTSRGSRPRRRDPSRPTGNHINVVIPEDENDSDDGIDPNLADRIAALERDMYGEDGSIPRHHRRPDDYVLEELSSEAEEEGYVSWTEPEEDSRERHDSYTSW